MLDLEYSKTIPFPFDVVLSQYFDYEHIRHVHPHTLGEYRLLEADGNVLVYEQIWPPNWLGIRRTSRVQQTFYPPNRTEFLFLEGLNRGVRVVSLLTDLGDSTLVKENYLLPYPNWTWIKPLIRPLMMRVIERIWKEDLDVEVCSGGAPGVPNYSLPPSSVEYISPQSRAKLHLGSVSQFPLGTMHVHKVEGKEILLVNHEGRLFAMENRCSHAGGPLSLGRCENRSIFCPWHGAQFDLEGGNSLSDCTLRHLAIFPVEIQGSDVVVYL
jgi:nitrite reductase/ring-hydroxylating ferredoxin subunit